MLADFLRFLTGQPPEMDQSECEAFVDAVVYTMLADKVIDPDEMEAVEEFAESFRGNLLIACTIMCAILSVGPRRIKIS